MKRAIITLIIIELCLVVALSGQQVINNIQETAAESQTLQSELNEIINNGVITIPPTPEPTAVSEATEKAEVTPTTKPEIFTIEMPKNALINDIEFINAQADALNVNVLTSEESVIYQVTADEQSKLIVNTKAYIDSIKSKTYSGNLQGIMYSDDYRVLTFIVNDDDYEELTEIDTIKGYFVLLQLLEGTSINNIDLTISIQDAQSEDKFEEYNYVDKYNPQTK